MDQPKNGINVVTVILSAVLLWLVIVAAGFAVLQFSNPFASRVEFRAAEKLAQRELEVSIPRLSREIVNPVTEVTVYANKEITIPENNRMTLSLIGRELGKYVYILKLTNIGLDDSKVDVIFSDSSGQESSHQLSITRKRFSFPLGYDAVVPNAGSEYLLDGDKFGQIVTNQTRMMEDYIPDDLVDLNKELGLYTFNNAELRAEPAQALKAMLDAMAAETGVYVTIASGYRSFETQVRTYASWVKELGQKQADKVSARPGHSQHQTGAAVDFTNEESNWELVNSFGSTTAGKWLKKNAEKYGFAQSYTKDQSKDGGFIEEAWHYLYFGAAN